MRLLPWLALTLLGSAAHAEPSIRRPCSPDEPAYREADRELRALDAAVTALSPTTDPRSLLARIEALSRSRCYQLLEDAVSLHTGAAPALQTWWKDGGHDHLRSYLDLGRPGPRFLAEPPFIRKTMGEVFPAGHPLASLVCPPADRACGVDTAGWRMRLDVALAPEEVGCGRVPLAPGEPPRHPEECGPYAQKAPPDHRFERFQTCLRIASIRSRRFAPLGRLRALDRGWLVVADLRADVGRCHEVRAYDLTTGAAIRAASCSEPPTLESEVGQVPISAIREAAWSLLLLAALEDVQPRGVLAYLPVGVSPLLTPDREATNVTFGGCWWGGTHQIHGASWRIQDGAGLLGSGDLTWPERYNARPEAHAISLVAIADAGFVPGCPPASPPRTLVQQNSRVSAAWRRAMARAEGCRARIEPAAGPEW